MFSTILLAFFFLFQTSPPIQKSISENPKTVKFINGNWFNGKSLFWKTIRW